MKALFDRDDDRIKTYIERLEAALKPFAEANIEQYTRYNDNSHVKVAVEAAWESNGVTIGDFRRAHDVLYPPSVK